MSATRYCSACGEKLKSNRSGLLALRNSCARCGKRFVQGRLLWFILLPMCLAIGFAIGNYSKAREPFQYIGEAIEPGEHTATLPGAVEATVPDRNVSGSGQGENGRASLVVEGICGARTKSGRPCQRRVKGGGRCWQHRDK